MSDNHEPVGPADSITGPFVAFWSSYIQQANESTKALMENLDDNADPRTWQRRWLDAVTKSMDAYLRSPVFLAAMKQNTDMIIKAKRQTDDLSKDIARQINIPTTSDISGLFERLHSVEEVILSRLGRIEERIAAVEERMGANQEVGS